MKKCLLFLGFILVANLFTMAQENDVEKNITFSNNYSTDSDLQSMENPKKWTWFVAGSYGGITDYFNKHLIEKYTEIKFSTYGASGGVLYEIGQENLEGMLLSPYVGISIGFLGYTTTLKHQRQVWTSEERNAWNNHDKDSLISTSHGGYAHINPQIGCRIGSPAFLVDFRCFYQLTSIDSITVADRNIPRSLAQGFRHSIGISIGFWLHQHLYLGIQNEYHRKSFNFYSFQIGWGF
ncbi:MAG: hypothetical protein IJ764_04535 [Bacteroidales bacterium]|nr:hypothetical protein [Bacteroidales bacterium]